MNTRNAKKAIRKITGHISFGEMLLSLRLGQERTQVEMADILGITKQDLCNIEKGRKIVSVERAAAFARSLSLPPVSFAKYALQDQLHRAGIKGEVIIHQAA